jgi:hypothetical protein
MEAAVAVRRGGKSRGAYLQWLDNAIATASDFIEEEALRVARKAFTDEFYPK